MKHSRALKELQEHRTHENPRLLGRGQFAVPISKRRKERVEISDSSAGIRIGDDYQARIPCLGESCLQRCDILLSYNQL